MKGFQIYALIDPKGLEVHVSNYGAKILSLLAPNARGERADVVLGFATPEEWLSKETYFNAVIGRCANRIKNGHFVLNGHEYQLPCNNGTNSLHGGVHGFNEKFWDVVSADAQHIKLHYRAADGEEGYPGNLDVYVTYRVENNALSISYEATTDQPTIVNFTNHAYFNLNGEDSPSVRDHTLQVLADEYTPFDETACPTGAILPVDGTPMDFRTPHTIGERIDDPFFAPGLGIDNNWVLPANPSHTLRLAAVLSASERTMEVWTTTPALQVYTGNYVEHNIGKGGSMYAPQNAVCLETHNIPDAVNHDNFPSPILLPDGKYCEQTIYKFR
jgi:aldose 1-epimerase